MKMILLLPLMLGGCVQAAPDYQVVLDGYAANAAQGDLEAWLTGSALVSARQSKDMIAELGLTQFGKAGFEPIYEHQGGLFSCLDMSEVGFVDASGEQLLLERQADRILMKVEFVEHPKLRLATIEQVGLC